VAAAAVDHTGHPVAGVAVTYPEDEVDAARRAQLAEAVSATARVLSRGIGGW